MLSRREVAGGLLSLGLSSVGGAPAAAQTMGAPRLTSLSPKDARIFQAIENLPWVASSGPAEFPVYVLYAPWCPVCKKLMQDHAEQKLPLFDVQHRWIGASPGDARQSQLLANAVKTRKFSDVQAAVLGNTAPQSALPEAYAARAYASTLLFYFIKSSLRVAGSPTGYPTFIYADQNQVQYRAGYDASNIASWRSFKPRSDANFVPMTYQALDDTWSDAGPVPGGRFSTSEKEYDVYALPYDWALPFTRLDRMKTASALRYLRVKGQRWVELHQIYTIGQRNYNGYVKA